MNNVILRNKCDDGDFSQKQVKEFASSTCRWECNIKMNLQEIGPYFFKESSELTAFVHDGVTLCSELLFWTDFTVRIALNR
jgi:hypothetical protein